MGKVRRRTGKFLVIFSSGQVLLGRIQWIISLLVFLKIFNLPHWTYYVALPFVVVVTFVIGWFYETLGMRRVFDEENSKYVIEKLKKVD